MPGGMLQIAQATAHALGWIVACWRQAANSGCPLHVRCWVVKRTRYAQAEFFRV